MIKEDGKIPVCFIVNPIAGVQSKDTLTYHLEKKLDLQKFEYKILVTEYPRHATELCRQALQEGYRIIVAVGGDGTVNEVARPMVGTEYHLGIIPLGSGNGLARHLQIPTDIDEAIRVINIGHVKKIDTVEINDQIFVSIAGIGFDALVAKKFAQQNRRGLWGYLKVTIREYFRYRPRKFKLIVDGKRLYREALFISFANSDQFGYRTTIAPEASADDGMIDVVIVKKIPLWQTLLWLPALFFRKINRSPYVEIIKAKEVDIRNKVKTINLDGEPVKVGKRLHIHIIPSSLNVIVP